MEIDWSSLSTHMSARDLIESGNGLLFLVGGFVLLGLAFPLVPMIITLIREYALTGKENEFYKQTGARKGRSRGERLSVAMDMTKHKHFD
ncbi:hypothetical protein [Amphibacillus cookii]|uniref:hypothetical protein n=1 Tax=Amphibacillus cookii TaxID=767787 RepID=UPI001957746E|nr:hypothetical protein [Amphibacillus cookii]MBM7543253.1 hypothetical protein [Amphibacillus cookii]